MRFQMAHLMCLGGKNNKILLLNKLCQFHKETERKQHLYWMFLNCRPFIVSNCCQSASLSPFPVPTRTEVRMVRGNKDQGKSAEVMDCGQTESKSHKSVSFDSSTCIPISAFMSCVM